MVFLFKTSSVGKKIQGITAENVNLSEYEQRGETWKKFYESMDPQDRAQYKMFRTLGVCMRLPMYVFSILRG